MTESNVAEQHMTWVSILMGSESDWPIMELTVELREKRGVAHEVMVTSAHLTPEGGRHDQAFNLTDNVAPVVGTHRMASPWAALVHTDRSAERARARELLDHVIVGDAAEARPSELPLG